MKGSLRDAPFGNVLVLHGNCTSSFIFIQFLCSLRWKMFFKTLEECLLTGKKFNSDDFKVVFGIVICNKMKMFWKKNMHSDEFREDTGNWVHQIKKNVSNWNYWEHSPGRMMDPIGRAQNGYKNISQIIFQVVRDVHAKWRPYFHLADDLDK